MLRSQIVDLSGDTDHLDSLAAESENEHEAWEPDAGKNYTTVSVYFGTNRNFAPQAETEEVFGKERAPTGTIYYGTCDVSIPKNHVRGELESPTWWKLEFKPDPEKHVVYLRPNVASRAYIFSSIREKIAASCGKNAFVFVHGYNVSFPDAARRTAQIAYDIRFDGAPIFFSWPSQGETVPYTVDENNIGWAEADMKAFLIDVLENSTAENNYLVAHSMGNRALTSAVAKIYAERPELATKICEVILAAPDIDTDTFRRDIAPRLTAAGRPITLYASSRDKALMASKEVHGYPRLGDTAEGLFQYPGIESIDASELDTDFLGHSYIANSCTVLTDVYYLVRERLRPAGRCTLGALIPSVDGCWRLRNDLPCDWPPTCPLF